ncbi:MAG TPA: exodeoxyribonuclease V subunit gamma, partial [Opitutales bacterium]|nr:exodeoxyribonuclease V subunit gamma [Opitutales bacterium]
MGLQGRDFLDQLLEAGFVELPGSFPSPGASTELNRLQEEIVRLQPRHEAGAPDDSIEVVSCAGPMREVEVLKDRLLALFEKDGTLRPRDVLVLAPDISVYAPCIEAVFGGGDGKDFIPFAVADRKVTELPAVDAFLRLLALANSRRTLRDILSFAEHPAIAARFGMDEGEIAAARDILAQTSVRWGLDESDREALGFGRVALNSWKAGVDSLALGAMMEPGALFGEVSAYGPAEGEILALAGRMAALFDSTRKALALLAEPRPLAGWPAALSEAAGLVLPTGDAESGCGLVHEAIGRLGESAELAGPDPVDCRVIADAMQGILAESYAPPGFLSGGVTFAELKPMRSIPARIMCLLGMNDAAFPRQDRPLSFDRSTRERRRGDRSIREGDRYLFLETLLCARERLYLSFGGLSQRGAAETPPSVVVSELLEYLSPGHASSRIVRHPLQSFSRQYFSGGRFFSYSRMDYEAALAGLRPAPERPFFAAEAVPPSEMPQLVDFDDLDRAFRHPARFFAGGILGLRRPCAEESAACDEPVEIAAPERSVECERMVAALLSGGGVEAICRSARARGILPWGLSGESAAAETGNEALVFSNAVRPLVASPVSRLEGEFTLDRAGLVLRGRLAPVHDGVLVRMRTARIRAVDRLSLWLAALLAGAMKELGTDGSENFRCCTLVCRDASLSIRVPDQALKRLEGIAGLYLKGLHSPLPFFPETSLEYVREGGRSKRSPLERALGVWTGGNFPESADPWNALVWRGREPVSAASGFTDAAVILWNGYFDCAEESQT